MIFFWYMARAIMSKAESFTNVCMPSGRNCVGRSGKLAYQGVYTILFWYMARAIMSKAESFTNVCNSKTCFRVRRLAPEQKKRRTRKSFACFFNKASICHFGKIWRMGVCLPKQFRLFPPKQLPLDPSASDTEKQLPKQQSPCVFCRLYRRLSQQRLY